MQTVDVRERGACGDGCADDSQAIQNVLDSGAPVVHIPEGVYLLGAGLKVSSGTTVLADANAVMRLGDGVGTNKDVFVLTNRNHDGGNNDIVIDGGVWDGNNAVNHRGGRHDPNGYSGVAINFVNVKGLTIRNLTVMNPDSYFIRMGEVEDFTVEDILLESTNPRLNNDGVHIGGFSRRGKIRRIRAETPLTPNDDMVAINADDDMSRVETVGIKCGPISDIQVEDISARDAYDFVRILSKDMPIDNIDIRRISGACRWYVVNLQNWEFPVGVGHISNVRISDFRVAKTDIPHVISPAMVDIALGVQDLHISNLSRSPDTHPDALTLWLHNDRDNRFRINGMEEQVIKPGEEYSLADGDIIDFVLNPTDSVKA